MRNRESFHLFLKFLLTAVMFTILPPYVTYNFSLREVLDINSFILTNSIRSDLSFLFPIFNLITLTIVFGTFLSGKIFSKTFSILISINYFISGILQNISISDKYGFAITISTLFLTLFAAGAWIFEVYSNQNDFAKSPQARRLLVFVPIALLAVWQPINPSTLKLDFNPVYFLTSGSSLTFCMMTVISLSVLLAYYPNINRTTLMITSIVGFLIGIGNLWLEFIHLPDLFWVGILHLPLVFISLTGVLFSFIKTTK